MEWDMGLGLFNFFLSHFGSILLDNEFEDSLSSLPRNTYDLPHSLNIICFHFCPLFLLKIPTSCLPLLPMCILLASKFSITMSEPKTHNNQISL